MKDRDVLDRLNAADKEAKALLPAEPEKALAALDAALLEIATAGAALPEKSVVPAIDAKRAHALALLDRHAEAVEAATRALAHPTLQTSSFLEAKLREDTTTLLVSSCARLGRWDEAIVATAEQARFAKLPSKMQQLGVAARIVSLYARRGALDAARARMDEAQALDPKDGALDVMAAWLRYGRGDRAGARIELQTLVDKRRRPELAKPALADLDAAAEPGPAPHGPTCRAEAEACLAARPALAEHLFELAAFAEPGSSAPWNGRGRAREALGRHEDALRAWDEALVRDGRDALARAGKARALLALGRPDEAREAIDEALALSPHLAHDVAADLFARGDLDGAERVLAPRLDDPSVLALAGTVALRLGRPRDAEARFRGALAAGNASVRPALCDALLAAGDPAGALAALDGTLGEHERSARALAALGRTDEAVERAAEVAGTAGTVLRAQILAAAGRTDEARATWTNAMVAAPGDPVLARGFAGFLGGDPGWLRTAAGLERLQTDPVGALALFEEAEKAEPGEKRHALDAARALAAKVKPFDAIKRATDAAVGLTDRLLLARLGEVCAMAKMAFKAQDPWEKAIEADPTLQADYEVFLAKHGLKPRGKAAKARVAAASNEPPKLAVRELIGRFLDLDKAGRLHEYLAWIEASGGVDATPGSGRYRVDLATACLRLCRHADAEAHLAKAFEDVSPGDRSRSLALRARLAARHGRLDDALLDAEEALAAHPTERERAELLGRRALWLAQKGAAPLALGHADLVRLSSAATDAMHLVGHALLVLDDRMEARRAFALGADASGEAGAEARLGLAMVETLLGELDAAREHLTGLTGRADDAWFRLRLALPLDVAERPPGVREALEGVLALAPGPDIAAAVRGGLAALAWDAGRRDDALATWDALDDPGAKKLAEHVRANAGARKGRLPAFPTVAQKRAHCGPASLELVLRYYGRLGEQHAIGEVVKRPGSGTPGWLLTKYLRDQGFVVRRVDAPLERLRELVDAGVPALVEEEYSTSTHVAVVVGYDDELGVLLVQDPMTHRLRRTPYEEAGRLRALFGHSAIVAAPEGDPRVAVIEALPPAPHLVAAEEGFRLFEAGDLDRAAAAFAGAVELRPDVPLGHIGRLEVATSALRHGDASGADALRQLGEAARVAFPTAEWPHRFAGTLALAEGRISDAMVAFQAAHAADPADGDNLACLGDCLATLGRVEEAEASWRRALLVQPSQPDAHEGLAALAIDRDDPRRATHFATTARAIDHRRARPWELVGRLAEASGQLDEALKCFAHAIERAPQLPSAKVARGRCLVRLGRREDGLRSLADAIADAPRSVHSRLEVAKVYLELEDPQAAWDALVPVEDVAAVNVTVAAVLAGCLLRLKRADEGEARMRAVLARAPDYLWAHQELFRGLLANGRAEAALALAEAAFSAEPTPHLRLELAEALFALGRADEALGHARVLLAEVGAWADLVARLARLAEAASRRADAKGLFERGIDRSLDLARPDRALVRAYASFLGDVGEADQALAWARAEGAWGMLGQEPALAVFEELLAKHPGDPRHAFGAILALEALRRNDEAFARSRALCEACDWRDPHLVRRHGELGWRTRVFTGSPVPAFEEALERNPDDEGIVAALVQLQEDKGHGDSHYALHWKKKLAEIRAAAR